MENTNLLLFCTAKKSCWLHSRSIFFAEHTFYDNIKKINFRFNIWMLINLNIKFNLQISFFCLVTEAFKLLVTQTFQFLIHFFEAMTFNICAFAHFSRLQRKPIFQTNTPTILVCSTKKNHTCYFFKLRLLSCTHL